jgi:hypothetical protein
VTASLQMLPEAPMAPDARFAAQRLGNKIFNYFLKPNPRFHLPPCPHELELLEWRHAAAGVSAKHCILPTSLIIYMLTPLSLMPPFQGSASRRAMVSTASLHLAQQT